METLGLMFVFVKLFDGARVSAQINVIVLALNQSFGLLATFLAVLIVFNIAMTPLAQAIWGTYLIGYKTFSDSVASVFMIAYSKGNLELLLEINTIWSLIFMVMYYAMAIFVLHAAFHNT